MKEFFQKVKTRIHHATPLIVARRILPLFADRLADPLFELRLREIVVIDPALVARVVWRIDINALNPSGMGRKKGLQSDEIIAFNNEIAAESRLLTLF